eukprot:TRINITY_DN8235_c0_g1_i1.p1 TRINITY_DN8235_c0_g1~~TRINITY_DN8235_c0_g1_i1.p1  ORF type:complete len:541 (+),score=75.45 TRINITY_DN8235_c0_g1_i1:43-1665(+)
MATCSKGILDVTVESATNPIFGVKDTLTGIKNGLGLQFLTKAATIVLNQALFCVVGTKITGIAGMQLHLVLVTILSLSREGVRRAAQRSMLFQQAATSSAISSLVTISWISALCSVVVAGIVDSAALYWIPIDTSVVSHAEFQTHVRWFCVAAVLEMLSEPAFVLLFALQVSSVRLRVEAAAVLVKSIVIAVLVIGYDLRLYAFSYGQVAFSTTLLIGYYAHFYWNCATQQSIVSSFSQLLPWVRTPIASDLKHDALVMSGHSCLKFVLTEVETIVLILFSTLSDQGVFVQVSRFCSSIARIVFLPIEEHAAHLFAHLLKPNDIAPPSLASRKLAANILQILVKVMLVIGFSAIAFGPSYSVLVVQHLMRGEWVHTNAAVVMSAYCGYIALIAVNGVTEAFVSAVSKHAEQGRHTGMMILIAALCIPVTIECTQRWSSLGLVAANSFSMLLRVLYSGVFICRYFGGIGVLWPSLPRGATTMWLLAMMVLTQLCTRYLGEQQLLTVAFGVVAAIATLRILYRFEIGAVSELQKLSSGPVVL